MSWRRSRRARPATTLIWKGPNEIGFGAPEEEYRMPPEELTQTIPPPAVDPWAGHPLFRSRPMRVQPSERRISEMVREAKRQQRQEMLDMTERIYLPRRSGGRHRHVD